MTNNNDYKNKYRDVDRAGGGGGLRAEAPPIIVKILRVLSTGDEI